MVSDLVTAIRGMVAQNFALPTSSPTTTIPPITVLPNMGFIPLPTALAPNGALPNSIRSLFSKVETAIIMAIITHEFKATDLHKLNSKYQHTDTAYTFNGLTNQFEASNITAKEYKNPNSTIISLQIYFSILQAHITDQWANIASQFFSYNVHLLKIASEYEWAAVLDYHMEFFNMWHTEMMDKLYSGWGTVDAALMAEHVLGCHKPMATKPAKANMPQTLANPSDSCRKFNKGRCTGTTCPWNRPHTCITCSSKDHGKHQHKD
ncbi:hypothetical protein H0H87_002962 [Tephrocybe sp. NHM501043]|nr:hypothetical protein H0H87_002962 [Tephrocybe sp. NHM501043]